MNLIIDASNIRAGGGITHLKEILTHGDPEKFGFQAVEVWAPRSTIALLPEKHWLKKKDHKLLNGNYFQRLVWKKKIVANRLRNFDVAFTPGTGYYKGKPVVTMCQNLLPLDIGEMNRYFLSNTWLRLQILRWFHLQIFTKVNGTIFLNDYSYNCIPDKVKNRLSKVATIPHGVNERFYSKKNNYESKNIFNFLYVSIIDVYKHQWNIAKAVYELRQDRYPIELSLIGPAYKPALKKLKNVMHQYSTDQKGVKWFGKVEYDNLSKFYFEADAAIYASTCETFGMTLLESMAAGLPIACSNKSSMPEMLKDAGVYFNPEDIESIKQAILKIYEDGELRSMLGHRAQQYARKYSWEKTADQTFEFLANVASSCAG